MAIPRKKAPDKDKPYNDGTWTEGRFNSFIKSTLRSGSQRWPPKYKALNAANAALTELKGLLDNSRLINDKLSKTTISKAKKLLAST